MNSKKFMTSTCSYSESSGLSQDRQNMLSVMVTWGKRRSHKYKWKIDSTVNMMETNLLLNFLTACLAAFIRCMCGGTSWNCMYDSPKYCFRSSDTSLYMMCSFGVNPRFLNLS